MKHTKLIKELLRKDRYTCSILHDVFGIDFEKAVKIAKAPTPVTINRMLKETPGYTTADSRIVMLLSFPEDVCKWRNYMFVQITNGPDFIVDQKVYRYSRGYNNSSLESFYRKGDFNDYRRMAGGVAYIIAQKKDLSSPVKEYDHYKKNVDFSARFVDLHKYTACSYNGHTEPYNRMELMLTDNTCHKITYTGKGEDLNAIIDKSGYLVDRKRADLKRRAEALRVERAKAAFRITDNASIINGLQERLTALKNELAAQLLQAETADDIKRIGDKIKYFNGLEGAYLDFARITKKDSEKSFDSIGSFNRAVNDLNALISKIAG